MKLSQKISTLFMIAMVFIASTGMTLNLHFCSDNLKNISFEQSNNHNCCKNKKQQENKKDCSKHEGCKTKSDKSSCCKDAKVKAEKPIKADTSVKKEISFEQSVIFIQSYILSFLTFDIVNSNDYRKPDESLFPQPKEGLYILLNQFRN